jgi:hypothetical protein
MTLMSQYAQNAFVIKLLENLPAFLEFKICYVPILSQFNPVQSHAVFP